MIIVNKNGTLIHNKIRYKCAIGKKGITKKKREGDKKTPAGVFSLGKVFYRKDKIKNLKTNLSKYIIKKNMAWCDDPNDKSYNKLIFTNNKKKKNYIERIIYITLLSLLIIMFGLQLKIKEAQFLSILQEKIIVERWVVLV